MALRILTWLQDGGGYGPSWFRKQAANRRPEPRSDSSWTREPVMTNLVKRFAKDESGATAVEYGLVAAGISVAIIAVMQGLGSKLNTTFSSVQSAFK
jgi:pilus assembly protein Flp/PilA